MPVVTEQNNTQRVVVQNKRTLTAVNQGIEHVVSDERGAVAVVKKEVEVLHASGVGVQGVQGEDGVGDNETFNDNLALLYGIAKL